MPTSIFEVSGAGDAAANGCYHFHKEVNGKPCFQNPESGYYLGFKEMSEWVAVGWGIRKEETARSVYYTGSLEDEPPSTGWKTFQEAPLPLPTVRRKLSQTLKRKCDVVRDVQEQVWKQRKFTDAEVVCAGVRTAVHRSTLCAASPVFDAAFSSAMQEGRNAVYEIKESTPAVVEAMLHYIYTANLACPSAELQLLLDLAVQYQLADLCAEAAVDLTKNVTVDNVRSRFAMLKRHSDNKGIKHALKTMVKLVREDVSDALLLALG